MAERNERNDRAPERRQAEGVRIIGAEEAQKALDAGQAAGRRSDDELRYGDVPPAPSGPRPPHRFPLPDSVDPAAAVPLSPVAPFKTEPTVVRGRHGDAGPTGANSPREPEAQSDDDSIDVPAGGSRSAEGADRPDESLDDPIAADAPTGPMPTVASGWADRGGDEERYGAGDRSSGPDEQTLWRIELGDDAESAWPAPASPPSGDAPSVASTYDPATYDPATYDPATYDPASYKPATTYDPARYESSGYQPSTYDSSSYRTPSTQPEGRDRPSSPAADTGAGWREPVPAGRVPGSAAPDPYASGGMADQPEDELTTVSPWMPPAEGQDRSWNLGERQDDVDVPPLAAPVPDLAPPEEGITLTGSHQLRHWSEPASGEVPAAFGDAGVNDDADEAWDVVGAQQARWRSGHDDWDDDQSDVHYLAGGEEPGGPLDSDQGDRSDLYSFDEDFERLEEERSGTHQAVPFDGGEAPADEPAAASGATRLTTRRRIGTSSRTAPGQRRIPGAPLRSGRVNNNGGELSSRLAFGAGLIVLLAIAYLLGPKALLVLAAVVVVACAAESYGILQRSGFRPATLLGLVATGGLMFAGYWRGIGALPLVVALTFAATMVWYLLSIVEARPLANVAVTTMAVLWVGLFGSFAALLLRVGDGRGLLLGVVVVVVASDIVSYFVGRQLGRRLLAPDISPGKTVEGLVAGIVAAVAVGAIVGHAISPWGGVKHGLLLGAVVAILAPIGDLFESLIKRDLNVKDSGTTLGGHGGLLDRFDSLLLVLPGAYFLASYLNILR